MAARGAVSKDIITKKILEVFPGSFQHEKELRIPMNEAGETIEIKVTLTAAKTNVGSNVVRSAFDSSIATEKVAETQAVEPSEEEKARVIELMTRLNL